MEIIDINRLRNKETLDGIEPTDRDRSLAELKNILEQKRSLLEIQRNNELEAAEIKTRECSAEQQERKIKTTAESDDILFVSKFTSSSGIDACGRVFSAIERRPVARFASTSKGLPARGYGHCRESLQGAHVTRFCPHGEDW